MIHPMYLIVAPCTSIRDLPGPLIKQIQQNLGTFETYFLTLEAVLDLQNSTKQLLSFRTNLPTPSFNFLRTKKNHQKIIKKHEVPLILFIKNQAIVFLKSKIKTFTKVCIISKSSSWS
jgi:hypothetical protein